jgi:Integrase core domain
MSTIASSGAVPSNVEATVKAANATDLSSKTKEMLANKFDKDYQILLKSLQMKKFKDTEDLLSRWDEEKYGPLQEEDDIYMWRDLVVLTQDMIPGILESEWKDSGLPPSCGRTRFKSFLAQRYVCGPSSPQVTDFLSGDPDHQQHRQRKRSQRAKSTVSQAPFNQLMIDLSDIPKRGQWRYLMCVVDLFSKMAFVVALSKKSGSIVARELEKLIDTMPAKPKSLRSDNGAEFKNPEMTELLERIDCKQIFGIAGNPLSQGAIGKYCTIRKIQRSHIIHILTRRSYHSYSFYKQRLSTEQSRCNCSLRKTVITQKQWAPSYLGSKGS